MSKEDFQDALVGSVAYEYAEVIRKNAGLGNDESEDGDSRNTGVLTSVNPDGRLVNCIPPEHLSPLGPVAYLQELLRVSPKLACEDYLPTDEECTRNEYCLNTRLTERRGPLGNLLASDANLSVPLPLIDLVNESLEYMVAAETTSGTIYDTDKDHQVGTHDPATLMEALPEHSTPNSEQQAAWDKIKKDFSACNLPYHQPFDVVRTYLEQLGTNRYATMRRFRKEITEFVLEPTNEPDDFQKHLWRYPVRHELALEYLGITPKNTQCSITLANWGRKSCRNYMDSCQRVAMKPILGRRR